YFGFFQQRAPVQTTSQSQAQIQFLEELDPCMKEGVALFYPSRLFHDLDTVFKDDIHQPTIRAGTKAPRQPWHDLHCKIDGHAAHDVLLNSDKDREKLQSGEDLH
ncbi:phospholipase D delta, partial [Tanacetum coccineum]